VREIVRLIYVVMVVIGILTVTVSHIRFIAARVVVLAKQEFVRLDTTGHLRVGDVGRMVLVTGASAGSIIRDTHTS
jgi:hypothetical protein